MFILQEGSQEIMKEAIAEKLDIKQLIAFPGAASSNTFGIVDLGCATRSY